MEKLKNCPLCGGETILCGGPTAYYGYTQISIICLGCGMEFKPLHKANENVAEYIADPQKSIREIVEKFNRRDGTEKSLDGTKEAHGHWIFWAGWRGNHDRRIDEATCSECGFEHPTVRHVVDPKESLSKLCPNCKAIMDQEPEQKGAND